MPSNRLIFKEEGALVITKKDANKGLQVTLCPECDGEGEVQCNECSGFGFSDCFICIGKGWEYCSKCNGSGQEANV